MHDGVCNQSQSRLFTLEYVDIQVFEIVVRIEIWNKWLDLEDQINNKEWRWSIYENRLEYWIES